MQWCVTRKPERTGLSGYWSGRVLVFGNRRSGYGLFLEDAEELLAGEHPVRVFGRGYHGDRGHGAFEHNSTSAIGWVDEDERWILQPGRVADAVVYSVAVGVSRPDCRGV